MQKKHYLVIGGTSGIGLATTQKLLDEGNQVSVLSRGNHKPETQNELLHHYIADVTDSSVALPEISEVIDGLVYCPGSINLKPFRSLKAEDYLADLHVNFLGMVRAIQYYLPALRKSSAPSIVLFSTVAVQTGMTFHTSVSAAKGAVEGFARALAAELAPALRVNVVAPGLTDTPLASRFLNTDQKAEAAAARYPLGRYGSANDIAQMAVFLLGDQSSWITGQVMHLDGGMSAIS